MSKLRIFWEYILAALTVAVPIYLLFSVRLQTSDNIVSGMTQVNLSATQPKKKLKNLSGKTEKIG